MFYSCRAEKDKSSIRSELDELVSRLEHSERARVKLGVTSFLEVLYIKFVVFYKLVIFSRVTAWCFGFLTV